MTPGNEDIKELREALVNVKFGEVEVRVHEGSNFSMTITTLKNKLAANKERVVIHSRLRSSDKGEVRHKQCDS